MFKLLSHRYKKIGLIIAPIGLCLWVFMQLGFVSKLSQLLGITDATILNMSVAILGFFTFLFGTYALAFSKEKVEDEMIKNVRLESFQFAALLQMIALVLGIMVIGFMNNPPKDAGVMLFLSIAILFFWITYILRFNYIIHFRIFRYEK